ncbi:MAG TPA: hypothetical protein VMP00_13935 [Burkholderiales bacterium]|nr:hypothetical protein [Burkholderiales bacterium]
MRRSRPRDCEGALYAFYAGDRTPGYGEVHISLSLAEALLIDAGITDPSPEQTARAAAFSFASGGLGLEPERGSHTIQA